MHKVSVLVDYSNQVSNPGDLKTVVLVIVQKILKCLEIDADCEFTFRLYDGWDEMIRQQDPNHPIATQLSKHAQDVVRCIGEEFPYCYDVKKNIRVNVTLARTLLCAEKTPLEYTFRTKQECYRFQLADRENIWSPVKVNAPNLRFLGF